VVGGWRRGGRVPSRSVVASVTRRTATSKASSVAADVDCTPLTLRTNWRAAASISSAVAAGWRPRRVVMLRHMPAIVAPSPRDGTPATHGRALGGCATLDLAVDTDLPDAPSERQPERNPARTQSVTRSVLVLQFLEQHGDAGVTQLGEHLGVSPSTAHRLARTLCDVGFVAQDPRTERYHLGPALIPLGRAAEARSGFDSLRPELEELAATTGESVSLGVRQGSSVLIVLRVASPHPLRVDQQPGSKVPIHASAMGKAMLAFSTGGPTNRIRRLDPITEATITDPVRLDAELATIRARGWALNDQERDLGVRAIGVPLLDAITRTAVAAIAVQGPTLRVTDARIPEIAEMAVARAATMSRLLAGR
jgi:IclR family acetate operon transcriptional repressor